MKKAIKGLALIAFCIGASGCAHQTLKAPCGPTAGLTEPCGTSKPINGIKHAVIADIPDARKLIG